MFSSAGGASVLYYAALVCEREFMRSVLNACLYVLSLCAASSGAAGASEKLNWDFTCVQKDKLAEVSVTFADVLVNNLSVREKPAFGVKSLNEVEVTYSVVNRGTSKAHIEGQFLLADDTNLPLVAVVAAPDFGMVHAGSTGLARGDTLIEGGEMDRVSIVCLRFVAGF
jgi:hypothetical protein